MLRNPTASTVGRFAPRLCYWTVVAMVFALATWLRFRLPLDPIADRDTWTYLSPALRKLIGGAFEHMPYGRNFVYPGFLYLCLRFFGDFRAITVAQHLLGLLAGGVLLLAWQHWDSWQQGLFSRQTDRSTLKCNFGPKLWPYFWSALISIS